MKTFAIALAVALFPILAHAQSPADPVNRVMGVAKALWEGTENPAPDYFDGIYEDFSEAFVATYHAAAKYPAHDGGDSPFDYDVITSSQDGCPLKDVTVSPQGEKDGVSIVAVSFKLWTCAPDAESQAKINEVRFDVVRENGKALISDVHRLSEGKWDSLVAEMKDTIERGKNP